MKDIFRDVKISIEDVEKAKRIGEYICNKLIGNYDFIVSNIVVNYTTEPGHIYIEIYNPVTDVDIFSIISEAMKNESYS